MMLYTSLLSVGMIGVIIAAFMYADPAAGFPGETSRMLFFHVPQAWISALSFFISMVSSSFFLWRRTPIADEIAVTAAELGFLFSILATITGSIFAKATWGSYWNWDPRETSMVIFIIIYAAYFSIRNGVADEERKRIFSSAYSILAFAAVPFLVFIVPRITMSLHPEDTMDPTDPGLDRKTLFVFLCSLIVYTLLFFKMFALKLRLLYLERELK